MAEATWRAALVGLGWGIGATFAMTVLMVAAFATGLSPMPRPIPVAVVAQVLGPGTAQPVLLGAGILAHFAYGGFWGAVLAAFFRPVTLGKAVTLGVFLWLLMQVAFLPFLGWGFFGTAISPAIAIATLVLHLVYGVTLGVLAQWRPATEREHVRTAS